MKHVDIYMRDMLRTHEQIERQLGISRVQLDFLRQLGVSRELDYIRQMGNARILHASYGEQLTRTVETMGGMAEWHAMKSIDEMAKLTGALDSIGQMSGLAALEKQSREMESMIRGHGTVTFESDVPSKTAVYVSAVAKNGDIYVTSLHETGEVAPALARKPKIQLPPAAITLRIGHLLLSRKALNEVLKPSIDDMRLEYFEALHSDEPWRAKMVLIRWRWTIAKVIFLSLPLGWIKKLMLG